MNPELYYQRPMLDRMRHLCYLRVVYISVPVVIAATGPAFAQEFTTPISLEERVAHRLETIWHEGRMELYLPLRTYHLRSAYTQEKIDSFNEAPLGLGIGKGIYDSGGNWHGLYVMGIQDSHRKPEYFAGYACKTFWSLTGDFKLGLGFTAFLTTRADIAHYIPVPGVLPLFSLEYQKVSLESVYVPGGKSNGNILFFWSKISF